MQLSAPLTLEEIKALEDGCEVEVLWSGENEPWRYKVYHSHGGVYARTNEESVRGTYDSEKDLTRFIGSETPYTIVRKVGVLTLNQQEKDIVECFASVWAENGMGLYGHLSYQSVIDFLTKHGIEVPSSMITRLEQLENRGKK